jgi:predicted nucleotidyltransferase
LTQADIGQQLRQVLATRPEIKFAYLYGSFVEQETFHDVDVALYLDPVPADAFDYGMAMSVDLTRALRLPVDVQVINDLSIGFQHQVLQGRLLFTRDETFLTDFIEQVAIEYTAFSHFLPEYLEAVTT